MRRITQARIVSFDVFDTLVIRCVRKPSDVFSLVEHVADLRGIDGAKGFASARDSTEKKLRSVRRRGEVTLDEVYHALDKQYPGSDTARLKDLELEVERRLCVANRPIVGLFQSALRAGRRVVLASDMYLKVDTLRLLLKDCGISGYETLFLSSDLQKTKRHGDLFDEMLSELKASAYSVVHIGDNLRADCFQARKRGISTRVVVGDRLTNVWQAVMSKLIERVNGRQGTYPAIDLDRFAFRDDPLSVRVGRTTLGPVLYYFAAWLDREMKDNSVDAIFFLSRDGRLMQRAFQIVAPEHDSRYLYCSRRSVCTAALACCDNLDDMLSLLAFRPMGKLEDVVARFGVSFDNVIDAARTYGLEADDMVAREQLEKSGDVRSFLESIVSYVRSANLHSKRLAEKYLLKEFEGLDRVAVVDVGWHGHMQRAIQTLVKHAGVEVSGYYLGLRSNPAAPDLKRASFLFGPDTDSSARLERREKVGNAFFELMFSGDHGTVLAYEEDVRGNIVPILDRTNEIDDATSSFVKSLQSSAMEFVGHAATCDFSEFPWPSRDALLSTFMRIACRPSRIEAKEIGRLAFEDFEKGRLVQVRSRLEYLKNPALLSSDLAQSYWRPGFLRLLVGVRLDYGRIALLAQRVTRSRGL